ncbi:MAG: hypothetical protein KIT25_10610 [Enhydrobacter sp.]|nr:MAG: hypothetical protein KIT25_10610 [Enhydrobacter sp.]
MKEVGFAARLPLKKGLQHPITWYRQHRHAHPSGGIDLLDARNFITT